MTEPNSKTKAIALMIECFPNTKVTPAMQATLIEAAQGRSSAAVTNCCYDFRHGRAETNNPAFMPSTAEFSRHLEQCEIAVHRAMHSQHLIAEKKDKRTPEERAIVAEKMAFLKMHGPDATAKRYGINAKQAKG